MSDLAERRFQTAPMGKPLRVRMGSSKLRWRLPYPEPQTKEPLWALRSCSLDLFFGVL